jgi:hypothetical protein
MLTTTRPMLLEAMAQLRQAVLKAGLMPQVSVLHAL